MSTTTTQPWDIGVRSANYSIVNKREKFETFWDNPTVENLKEAAGSWWATITRWSMDHYVEDVVLDKGHSPENIRDMIQEVVDGERPITDAGIPGMGISTITEVLEIIDSEKYAALNSKSRAGMKALGYEIPDDGLDDEEYFVFVEDVKEAVEEYEFRERLAERDDVGNLSDVSDIDIAQAVFNLHDEDEFDFDLNRIREAERQTRVVDVEIPRGLYEQAGEIVSGNLLYLDEEDYIKSKLRDAIEEDLENDE